MHANEYQVRTGNTEIYTDASKRFMATVYTSRPGDQQHERCEKLLSLLYCTGKLNGEAGEVAEKVFKLLRDGSDTNYSIHPDVLEALFKELGDVMWYVARIADLIGFNLGDVMEENLEKLKSRKERGVLSGDGDER